MPQLHERRSEQSHMGPEVEISSSMSQFDRDPWSMSSSILFGLSPTGCGAMHEVSSTVKLKCSTSEDNEYVLPTETTYLSLIPPETIVHELVRFDLKRRNRNENTCRATTPASFVFETTIIIVVISIIIASIFITLLGINPVRYHFFLYLSSCIITSSSNEWSYWRLRVHISPKGYCYLFHWISKRICHGRRKTPWFSEGRHGKNEHVGKLQKVGWCCTKIWLFDCPLSHRIW